jgi:hypothetical protein
MSAAILRAPSRIVPTPRRLEQRDAPLALANILRTAEADLAAGNIANAWAGFHQALGQWLQAKWRDLSGKPNSPISDSATLVLKLRCSRYLDGWTYSLLLHIVENPKAEPTLQRVDMLAGIVRVLVKGGAA